MLLIILKKELGGRGKVSEEGGRELGVVSMPGWKVHNLPGVDSFPLALGSAWGHFCLFANTASLLLLLQSKAHVIPKFYHMWYVYICSMLGVWLC